MVSGCRSASESQDEPTGQEVEAARLSPQTAALERQRAETRAQLAAARDRQMTRLADYRKAKRFPRSHLVHGTIPVFVDDADTACAVGYLMREDGERDAVTAIQRDSNHIRVADVTSGPVHDWIATSGLIQEEAALIQPGYPRAMLEKWRKHQEERRLARHFFHVAKQLQEQREQSLDIAVERLLCARQVEGADCAGKGAAPVFDEPDGWQETEIAVPQVVELALADDRGCVRDEAGAVTCWESGGQTHAVAVTGAQAIAAARGNSCAVTGAGQVACWGTLGFGDPDWRYGSAPEAGDPPDLQPVVAPASAPVIIDGVKDATQVVLSGGVGCALRRTGRVSCWGTERDAPTRARAIGRLSAAVGLSVGASAGCAVDRKGRVHCWSLAAGAMKASPLRLFQQTCGPAAKKPKKGGGGGCRDKSLGPARDIAQVVLGDNPGDFADEMVLVGRDGQVREVDWMPGPGKHGEIEEDLELQAYVHPVVLPDPAALATLGQTLCAQAAKGRAHCWRGPFGPDPQPAPFASVQTIAAGGNQLCAIDEQARARCARWLGYPPIARLTASLDEKYKR